MTDPDRRRRRLRRVAETKPAPDVREDAETRLARLQAQAEVYEQDDPAPVVDPADALRRLARLQAQVDIRRGGSR